MIIKEFNQESGFQSPEIETPAQGWRRAEDAILGGVHGGEYRILSSACQPVIKLMERVQ